MQMGLRTRLRMTRRQRRVVGLSAAGGFVDGYDLLMLSAALLLVVPAYDLSSGEVGLLTAMAYAGSFFGSIAAGFWTDRYGRRQIYITSLAMMVLCAGLCAIAPGFAGLLVARFLIGVAIGADFPTSGAMIAEFAPARARGAALATWQLMWTVGALVAPFVGVAMLGIGDDAWRFMLLSGAVPALAILIARQTIPETPIWLASHGRQQEAAEVRAWADAGGEPEPIGAAEAPKTASSGLGRLWSDHRRGFVALAVLSLAGSFGPLFLGTYSAFLAKFYGFSTNKEALLFSMLIWVFYLLGNVLNIALTDRVGRRPLLLIGATLVLLSLLGASQLTLSEDTVGLVFVVLAFAALGHWGGVDQAIWQYSAELFPAAVRATGRGITTACTRASAFTSALLTPTLLSSLGFGKTMLIFCGTEAIAIAAALFLPEVRGLALDRAARAPREPRERPEETAPAISETRA